MPMRLPCPERWKTEEKCSRIIKGQVFSLEILNRISAEAGLGPLGAFGPLLVGVLLVLLAVKLFSLPLKLVWNGICGAAVLWVVNFLGAMVGFHMKITVLKALIAGFFGIPGAAAVVLFEIFGK